MSSDGQLTFIDFFAGIGGFRRGLELAGMKCIGFCEKDKFSVRSYRAMYDTQGEWYRSDITKIESREIPKADVWTAGSPCQNLSLAGKRSGLHGERSGLFFNFINLLKSQKEEDKPEWIILENVKGLLSSNSGWDYFEYLNEVAEAGYDLQWQVFNSKDYGVPQNRERVYTVGHLRRRGGREILPICSESSGNLKKIISGSQAYRVFDPSGIAVTIVGRAGGVGAKTGLYLIDQSTSTPKITEDARCITARYTAGATKRTAMNSAVLEIEKTSDVNETFYPILTPERTNKRQNGRRVKNAGEPMFTLIGQDRHGVLVETDINKEENQELKNKKKNSIKEIKLKNATKKGYQTAYLGDSVDLSYPKSNTRRARVGKEIANALSGSGSKGAVVLKDKMVRIRRLTPRECFRLQGFSDELFERAEEVNSDTQLYKQAGNAVTVNVVFAIGSEILNQYKTN